MSESIASIKAIFQNADISQLPELIDRYRPDDRGGVQKLLESAEKKCLALEAEKQRIEELCFYEKKYRDYDFICGIDEVGRGPLAGPVMAGAVILPKDCRILYVNDSKKLSEKKREELYEIITREALAWSVAQVSPERIDEINILQATYEAMRMALANLHPSPTLLLNDAVKIPGVNIPQVPIIKGDAKSISIGAASIVAKVSRDRLMQQYDLVFPEYGFASNKGYGSAQHMEALRQYGPTPIHRKSFLNNEWS